MLKYLDRPEKYLRSYPGLRRLLLSHKVFTRYFITPFLSLAFEVGLVYLFYIYGGTAIFWSSILRTTVDFVFTYFFSKYVSDSTYDERGFFLYLRTSILGMALDTWILTWSLAYFRSGLEKRATLWLGEILATGIPFFLKYLIRKYYFFLRRRKT